jgi:hypothetical protein
VSTQDAFGTADLRKIFEDHRGADIGKPVAVVHVGTYLTQSVSGRTVGEIEYAVVAERDDPSSQWGTLEVDRLYLLGHAGLWEEVPAHLFQWLVEDLEETVNHPDYEVQA